MKQASSVLLAVLAAASLAGCGGTLCDRLEAAQDKFYAGKATCTYSDGSSNVTLSRPGTCKDVSACSAEEQKAIDAFASCLTSATACTAGNEKQATTDGTGCLFVLASKVSQACAAALK